tara:strand:- start:20 stop:223 length:204 start_codon:yes stop_codon:yes gene_type:complete
MNKDIKTALKGSMGQVSNNLSEIMEMIADLDARVHMVERKMTFLVLPKERSEDEEDYWSNINPGGTD